MKILLSATAILLLLGGCARHEAAKPAEPPLVPIPGAYLGRAGESKVFLAVVPGTANTVRVYACDGEDLTNATVDQWFQGTLGETGTGPVTLSAGALKLTLSKADGAYSGEFFMGGRVFPFIATLPGEGSALLDAEVRDPQTGAVTRDGNVIVLDGEQRGSFIPTRPSKCRLVLVTSGSGTSSWVTVC